MGYIFLFIVFLVANSAIYMNFEIEGFLIYNFSVITIFMVMIYDKIGKKSYDIKSSKAYLEKQKLNQLLNENETKNTPLQKEDL